MGRSRTGDAEEQRAGLVGRSLRAGTSRRRSARSARSVRASRRSARASAGPATPRSNGRGGVVVGVAGPPFSQLTIDVSSPATYLRGSSWICTGTASMRIRSRSASAASSAPAGDPGAARHAQVDRVGADGSRGEHGAVEHEVGCHRRAGPVLRAGRLALHAVRDDARGGGQPCRTASSFRWVGNPAPPRPRGPIARSPPAGPRRHAGRGGAGHRSAGGGRAAPGGRALLVPAGEQPVSPSGPRMRRCSTPSLVSVALIRRAPVRSGRSPRLPVDRRSRPGAADGPACPRVRPTRAQRPGLEPAGDQQGREQDGRDARRADGIARRCACGRSATSRPLRSSRRMPATIPSSQRGRTSLPVPSPWTSASGQHA